MLLKSKGIVLIGALIGMGNAFSSEKIAPPICPNAIAIQEGGLIGAIPFFQRNFMTYNLSSYNTPTNWTFVMGPIVAKSEKIALNLGFDLLTTVTGMPRPQKNEAGDWACIYRTANPKVIAATVESEGTISAFALRELITNF